MRARLMNQSMHDQNTDTRSSTRFGVIGTGRITRRLVADLQSTEGVEVTAIASRQSERAQWFANQYGIAAAVTGYESLLKRDAVDAVYISLPPSLHAKWCMAAAAMGKHILCEKPLAMSAKEAFEIESSCADAGVRWLDATGWLHHSRTSNIRNWIDEKRFGNVCHITASVSFFRPFISGEHRLNPELGGGALLDLGWYTCGLIRFVAGRLPTRVFADAVFESGVPLRVTGIMWFEDGVTAGISCGYDSATRKWFEVAGSEASLICDDFTRPWDQRPARCWIHDPSGKAETHEFSGSQEREMISRLVGNDSLGSFQRQAIETQIILDVVSESISASSPVDLPKYGLAKENVQCR